MFKEDPLRDLERVQSRASGQIIRDRPNPETVGKRLFLFDLTNADLLFSCNRNWIRLIRKREFEEGVLFKKIP